MVISAAISVVELLQTRLRRSLSSRGIARVHLGSGNGAQAPSNGEAEERYGRDFHDPKHSSQDDAYGQLIHATPSLKMNWRQRPWRDREACVRFGYHYARNLRALSIRQRYRRHLGVTHCAIPVSQLQGDGTRSAAVPRSSLP